MAIDSVPGGPPTAPEAYADILKAYTVYDTELQNLSPDERKAFEPHGLLFYAWKGHFYAGKYQQKEFLPAIRLINHLALIDPAYVRLLQQRTSDMLAGDPAAFDPEAFIAEVDEVFKIIERDDVIERRAIAKHYFKDLMDPSKRDYKLQGGIDPQPYTSDELQYFALFNNSKNFQWKYTAYINNSNNKFFEEWLAQLTFGDTNLLLAYDLRKIREKLQAKKSAVAAELVKLRRDIDAVKGVHGLLSPEAAHEMAVANTTLTVANGTASLLAAGEGMVAAKGIADLGMGIPLPASFAVVGSAGAFANFFLTRDDTQATLDSLFGAQGEGPKTPSRNWFRRMSDWINDRKFFFDFEGKRISGAKKGFALVALISSIVVGGLFGYLSFISGWGMLTGLILGSVALPALPILAGVGLVSVVAFALASQLKGWKKWLAIGGLLAATVGLGFVAFPLLAGVIAGAVTLIAVSSAITLASILFVSMVDLVKKDGWNVLKKYLHDAFVNTAWKQLTFGQKLKHVFGHCLKSVFSIGMNFVINALSIGGQFIMFSAFMIKLTGSALLGYTFSGINAGVHIAFGFINIQQRLDAMLKFGRDTYAKLTQPQDETSRLQNVSKKPGVIATVVGYLAAIINGLGQGGLYGKQFVNAATAGMVSSIAIAVALVAILHVPVLIAGIVAGVGAFLFSALPNTNALSKTLNKDQVETVKPSGLTTRMLGQKLALAPQPEASLEKEVRAQSRLEPQGAGLLPLTASSAMASVRARGRMHRVDASHPFHDPATAQKTREEIAEAGQVATMVC